MQQSSHAGHDPQALRSVAEQRLAERDAGSTRHADDAASQDALVAAVAEVEIAHEELRVAQEELNAQYEQVQGLLTRLAVDRTWRERLSARLGLPVMVTDLAGVVVEANAAAGRLLAVAPEQLVGKPLVVFVDAPDRPAWRTRVGSPDGDADPGDVQGELDLRPRGGGSVRVQMLGLPEPGGDHERRTRWFLTVRPAEEADPVLSVARALSEMARLPVEHDGDLPQLLRAVTRLIHEALGADSGVSVTVGSPRQPEMQATDSSFAQQMDGAELTVGHGPCLEAYSTQVVVTSPSVADDPRWPRLGSLARQIGAASCIGVPLRTATEAVGVLNVFFAEPHPSLDDLAEPARLLADAATSVIVDVRELAATRALSVQLREAMDSRAGIEQAKGMIMVHLGCTADEAFQRLVAVSRNSNTKLRVLAELIVAEPSRLARLW